MLKFIGYKRDKERFDGVDYISDVYTYRVSDKRPARWRNKIEASMLSPNTWVDGDTIKIRRLPKDSPHEYHSKLFWKPRILEAL